MTRAGQEILRLERQQASDFNRRDLSINQFFAGVALER
jgi:hypothetical protein